MYIQKASLAKRSIAYLFDIMLLVMIAVLIGSWISGLLGYDALALELEQRYADVQTRFGVDFNISEEVYSAMSQQEQAQFDAAFEALSSDEETMGIYSKLIYMTIGVISGGLLVGYLALEFVVPLLLGNGMTLGKKVFGIALARVDSVRVSPLALFVRTVLGKFTIETMIPVLVVIMMVWGTMGIIGPIMVLALLVLQIVSMATSENRPALHDRLAGTVPVDFTTQLIFDNEEALAAYLSKQADPANESVY